MSASVQGNPLYSAVYDVALNAADRALLGAGVHPLKVRPQNLVSLIRFVGSKVSGELCPVG